MAKAGELNWDELKKSDDYKHTVVPLWVNDPSSGIAPKNPNAKPLLKNDQVPDKQSDEEIAEFILRGSQAPGVRQPTDQELFGHLVVSEEQVERAKAEFENRMQNTIAKLHTPIVGKTYEEEDAWASGKSFNETLSKEELIKRNMFTGEE